MAKRKKKNCILGLDIGSFSIKAVEVTRQGEELSVTGFSHEPVTDVSAFDDAIRNAVAAGAFSTSRVVVGFSGRSTMIQTIAVAVGKDDDLGEVVRAEAEKYIPYDISEAQIDYYPLDSLGASPARVLLVAARRQDIEDRLEVLFSAGVAPLIVDTELFALANAFEIANAGGALASTGKPAALVNIGATKTLIAVTDKTRHVFREFPLGGVALTEAVSKRLSCEMAEAERIKCAPNEENIDAVKDAMYSVIEDIGTEIVSSVDAFKGMGGKEPGTLLISGGTAAFNGVTPLLGKLAKVPAQIFSSFGGVPAPDVDEEFLQEHMHELTVAFGLGCRALA